MKISKRDISLLIGFLGILIAFLAYQFGYVKLQDKTEELKLQNSQMRAEIAELEALQENRDFYESETTRMDSEIKEMVGEFASNVLPEDEMKFAYQQDNTNLVGRLFITSLGFTDPALLYTTNQNNAAASTDGTTTDSTGTDSTGTEAASTSVAMNNVVIEGNLYPTYYLYQTQTNYGIECSYEGVKNIVRNVLKDDRRRGVETISLAYDDSTGQLNGSVVVDSYFLLGTDKPYAQPSLTPVTQGTDNIFSTIELPEAETENIAE